MKSLKKKIAGQALDMVMDRLDAMLGPDAKGLVRVRVRGPVGAQVTAQVEGHVAFQVHES